MPKVDFQEPVSIDDLITQGENGAIVNYDTDLLPDAGEIRSKGNSHQPFVVAIDASGSMTADAGNGKTKLQVCQDLITGLPQSEPIMKLSEVEKNAVDMLVLSFSGSEVDVYATWQPLSLFEGIQPITAGSTTPFYKTVVDSIQASRVMRKHYADNGIDCYRPQIFIYTDGLATDKNENYSEAKALCEEYAKEGGKVKIFVVLIPGSMSENDVNTACTEILSLSDNITVLRADDCVNGLPATFNFLASSVVVGASSSVGTEMKVKYDPNYVKVAGNTDVEDGAVITGKQIVWK